MDNQRHSARRRVFYYLEVEERSSGKVIGRLGDISPEGLMLLTKKTLPLEQRYTVAVHLPKGEAFRQATLSLDIETRWLRQDHNPDILCIGCRILDAELEKDKVFSALVAYYGFSDGYKQFKQTEAV